MNADTSHVVRAVVRQILDIYESVNPHPSTLSKLVGQASPELSLIDWPRSWKGLRNLAFQIQAVDQSQIPLSRVPNTIAAHQFLLCKHFGDGDCSWHHIGLQVARELTEWNNSSERTEEWWQQLITTYAEWRVLDDGLLEESEILFGSQACE